MRIVLNPQCMMYQLYPVHDLKKKIKYKSIVPTVNKKTKILLQTNPITQ